MKTTMKAILAFLLLASASLAPAQRGGTMHIGWPHRSADVSDQTPSATADQRAALSKCMQVTERLRSAIGRMPRIGSPWSRSRLTYTSRDLSAFSDLREQFEAALSDLATTHREFQKELTDDQASELMRHLKKLDRIEAKMNAGAAELDHDLETAKPGPASPNLSWDVNSIKRATDQWRSEHRKIAKEMGIPS